MTKGFCSVRFFGGTLDGEVMEIPSIHAGSSISKDSEAFFTLEPNGNIAIYRGERKPTVPWISFMREIYRKEDERVEDNIVHALQKTIDVERCQAKTKSGTRCGHEAIYEEKFCKSHSI